MKQAPDMPAEVLPSRKKLHGTNGQAPSGHHHHHHHKCHHGHGVDERDKDGGSLPGLRRSPTLGHKPGRYDDQKDLEYPAALYSAMEQFLPTHLLSSSRDKKISFLERILAKYRPNGEQRARKHREYWERIRHNYQPLHQELYTLDPDRFFERTYLDAVKDGTEEAFRNILTEHSPGVFTFNMLDSKFCTMIMDEVEHFENWARESKVKVMKPIKMNNYGAVLDDIGMQGILNELMTSFIKPIAAVLFANVGGSSLDTHHGFVLENSMDRNLDLDPGFYVDDSEITLNVCLGKEFDGGELFFRGVRCDKHVHGESRPEEVLEYSQVPGRAILHAGRHRHGVKAIRAGERTNLILWCRSSEFRELKKSQRDFSSWCGECLLKRRERRRRLSNSKRRLAS